MMNHSRPLLAITMGDPSGIGPEILVKSLANNTLDYQPLVIGSQESLQQAIEQTGIKCNFKVVADIESIVDCEGAVPVLEPAILDSNLIQQGSVSAEAGRVAVGYIEAAIQLAQESRVQGMVTCPINKEAIHLAGFVGDIGHQEILTRMTGSQLTATMLMTTGLRVAHLSTHKSLAEAVRYVKCPIIVEKLELTSRSLSDWGIKNPRIAVAALNPHGGEGGLLGREEIDEIKPAVVAANASGINAFGPYPADSVFYRAIDGEFDAVLALYHDQGHIAIKVHNFADSITATMGIPFIRTSVDHGTAFEIAGKNRATHRSLDQAINAAIAMAQGCLQVGF